MNEFDLHMHSNYSGDGQFTPAELIGIAKERGLKTIALSDHDCISGVKEMIKLGKEAGLPSSVLQALDIRMFIYWGMALMWMMNIFKTYLIRHRLNLVMRFQLVVIG